METVKEKVDKQRSFFLNQNTKDIKFRKRQLIILKEAIAHNEQEILLALKKDLNKSTFEGYATEIGMVYEEIGFMLHNINRLAKSKRVRTPITLFPAVSRIYKEPYGVVLIMSPWNYPFQLAMVPLIGAIATGNCTMIKPSNYSSNTSAVIRKIITENFKPEYISVVEGGREANQSLLEQKFDYIFFTGSVAIGRTVMEKAAAHLTPVTLELGGKSPCIIDKTADIKTTAKRLAWAKYLNAGQTCVAPDYLLIHESVKEEFLKELKKNIQTMYGEKPQENENFPKIINEKHFERLNKLIAGGKVIVGGNSNPATLQIEPTVFDQVSWSDEIMQEEIFGPIFPVITYKEIGEIVEKINSRPKPLALYLFTTSKSVEKTILGKISFGGGCVNGAILHLATSNMPFGGVGDSGMGNYHGEASFRTLSHEKSVLKKYVGFDVPLIYPPYGNRVNLLKKIMK